MSQTLPTIDDFNWTARDVRPPLTWSDREYSLVIMDRGCPVYLVGRIRTSYANEWILTRAASDDRRTLAIDAMASAVAKLPGSSAADARAAYEAMKDIVS